MRILWVKAGGLVPLDLGGKIRSYHILKNLARRHEVTLFTFYAEQSDDRHPQLKDIFSRVECYPLRLPATRSFAEGMLYLRHLFSSRPHTIAKFCQPQVAHAFQRLVQEERHDIIVCDFIFAAGIIPWETACPKVIFTHNVEALIWQRHYQVARNPLWKAVSWREYRAIARAERWYLERADHVIAVSEADRDFFARFIDPSRITVIPTGVDVDYFRKAPVDEKPSLLVFTGAMDWLANEDGVRYFVEEILPRIRSQIPDATLRVVGRRPSGKLYALAARDKQIQVTGWVEDVRPYVQDASVYVVPLRIGGGTRLKIFEAMAMGKAVVSTSIGAEGLPVRHGENILLADTPEGFAQGVVGLLRDGGKRRVLGQAGRQMVTENYSWERVAEQFDSVLANV